MKKNGIHIAELAWEKIKNDFSQNALTCFEELSKGRSVSDLARELNLKENSVFVNRQRVQESFHREIRILNEELN